MIDYQTDKLYYVCKGDTALVVFATESEAKEFIKGLGDDYTIRPMRLHVHAVPSH